MTINSIIAAVLLIAGFFFMAVSVIGVFRFTDFFSRLQVMGVGQALGTVLCCLGLFLYEGFSNAGIKIILIMIFTLVSGPIGTHIIDKVAYKESVRRKLEEESGREEEKICLLIQMSIIKIFVVIYICKLMNFNMKLRFKIKQHKLLSTLLD